MTIHATLSKTTDGRESKWYFCELDGTFFALRGNNKVVACKDIADMRNLFSTFKSKYNFQLIK